MGNYPQRFVITYKGKESEEGCVYVTESLCCTPETNTTLQISYVLLLLLLLLASVVFDSLLRYGLWPFRLLCPWDSPGKSTGVGCHALLQGIFLTRGWNPGLLHCRQILYRLSHRLGYSHPTILQFKKLK